MSIHKTGSGRYEVRWREAGRNRSKTFTRKGDADDFDAYQHRQRALGGVILRRQDTPTLEEWATEWLASRTDLSDRSLELYAGLLERHVLPTLGGYRLQELGPRMLASWLAALKTGGRTAQQARGVLHQVLQAAVREELVPTNAVGPLPQPRHQRRKVTIPSVAQVEAMRSWFLEGEFIGDATLISLLAYAGLRPPHEPMGLLWSDLRGERLRIERQNVDGQILPYTKSDRSTRLIELPAPVRSDLARWRLALGNREGLVFPRPDGTPWRKTSWGNWRRRRFAQASEAAGVENFRPYDLRHTCASLMIAAGRPVTEVAAHLGHSVSVSVSTYQHLVEDLAGKPVRPIEELIREVRATNERVAAHV